jgi:hypothetical protein
MAPLSLSIRDRSLCAAKRRLMIVSTEASGGIGKDVLQLIVAVKGNTMFRRMLVLSLVPLLLLPGICHAHAWISDHDPSGKDRSPHFHLRFFSCSLGQSEGDPHPCSLSSLDQTNTFDRSRSASDHDRDAVYLPLSILFGWQSSPKVDLVDPSVQLTLVAMVCDTHAMSGSVQPAALCSPPLPSESSPIPLQFLPLLI